MSILKEVMEMPEIRFKRLQHEAEMLRLELYGPGRMTDIDAQQTVEWFESQPPLPAGEWERLKRKYPGQVEALQFLYAMALRSEPKNPWDRRMQERIKKEPWVLAEIDQFNQEKFKRLKPNYSKKAKIRKIKQQYRNKHLRYLSGSYKKWDSADFVRYYYYGRGVALTLKDMGLIDDMWKVLHSKENSAWASSKNGIKNPSGFFIRLSEQIQRRAIEHIIKSKKTSGNLNFRLGTNATYNFLPLVWAMGSGVIRSSSFVRLEWQWRDEHCFLSGKADITVRYSDIFMDPVGIGLEDPNGHPYLYDQVWKENLIFSAEFY